MATPKRLLTADWIGIGLVALGHVGAVVDLPLLALASLGVLGPPILRELGWLRDDDDFTRQAAHKAGFHAMVLIMALFVADRLLLRLGAVRVIIGFGVLTGLTGVSNLLILIRSGDLNSMDYGFFLIVPFILLFAQLVARRPRVGGGIILALVGLTVAAMARQIAGLDSMPEHVREQGMFWGMMTGVVTVLVLFGPVGVALVRNREID